ncbi:MAG: hypothetical protein LBH59_07985 [Planctomycetaceae bacterium]|nr:hypothetical protein [Planctomycetaceae bacterium]
MTKLDTELLIPKPTAHAGFGIFVQKRIFVTNIMLHGQQISLTYTEAGMGGRLRP